MEISFKEIYKICQKYGKEKCKSASGGFYYKPTPKRCTEEIMKLITEKEKK